jgi:hypothetical protein
MMEPLATVGLDKRCAFITTAQLNVKLTKVVVIIITLAKPIAALLAILDDLSTTIAITVCLSVYSTCAVTGHGHNVTYRNHLCARITHPGFGILSCHWSCWHLLVIQHDLRCKGTVQFGKNKCGVLYLRVIPQLSDLCEVGNRPDITVPGIQLLASEDMVIVSKKLDHKVIHGQW